MSYISDVTINGSSSPISASLRGNCSTASATAAKVVSCTDFDTLKEGVSIFVTFTNDNTASNPTLNVNSTGAKAIKNGTSEIKWEAGQTAAFLYDGTYWQMIGGSGDIPDPLPSQAGQAGKFLTTDGTNASWGNVDALPSQTGQNGKFLTTNGTNASWSAVDIPDPVSINISSGELVITT